MNAQAEVFFARGYKYRKPGTFFAGLLGLAFGGLALRYVVLEASTTVWKPTAFLAAAFVGGIGGVLALCGLFLLRKWFVRGVLALEISGAGIRYGNAYHPWESIHWLGGRCDRKGIQLFYQTRDRWPGGIDRPLPVDPNLTQEEYEQLMETLSNRILQNHPHVVLGSARTTRSATL